MDDMALLREYAAGNSETAFEALVSRRVGFVYSMALRQVRDPYLAEEVTQAVFIILAQKAGRISGQTILAGWLFRTTRFAALAQMRADAKRRRREQEATMQSEIQPTTAPDAFWEQMSPLLDEALATLGETDRQAVLLRFFENKSLAEVGHSLGTGEDTARKRVSRALEKLHRYFSKQGVSSTTDVLAGAISANSVQAVPVALAKSVATVAMAKGAAASSSTLTLIQGALKIMAWTKAKTVIVVGTGVMLAAGTTTTLVAHYKPHSASPQIHIKTRFVEIPKDSADFLNSYPGILNDIGIFDAGDARTFLKILESKRGFETLAEPEVTTTSRRQVQIRTTQVITVITNFTYIETNSTGAIHPQTGTMEFGPILDVVPTILGNSRIQITTTASVTYFFGYADSSKLAPHYATNSAGQQITLPMILPMLQIKKSSTKTALANGQTLALILPKAEPLSFSKPAGEQWATPLLGNAVEYKNDEKATIVLITSELVDSMGKRILPIAR